MDEREWLAERFEEHRARLRGVAYRMLGSLSEAHDAVQEAWLRLNRTDASAVENLGGWLTTVVAWISLNMLRSRKTRREEPLAGGLPDPLIDRADGLDPEHEALLADSVGLALLAGTRALGGEQRRGDTVVTAGHIAAMSTREHLEHEPARRRPRTGAAPDGARTSLDLLRVPEADPALGTAHPPARRNGRPPALRDLQDPEPPALRPASLSALRGRCAGGEAR